MERLYTGIIKQIIKHKNKGIIVYTDDSGIEQKTLFFNLKLKGKTREKVHYSIHDEVTFKFISRISKEGTPYICAEIVSFIKNDVLYNFLEKHRPENIYTGFFKKISENQYYIKEKNTFLQFSKITPFFPKFLVPENNSLVSFQLQIKKNGTIRALLLNLQPNAEYSEFCKKNTHLATITEITDKFIYVKVKNFNFEGKVHYLNECPYKIGEDIYVIVAGVDKKGIINFKTVL
ncbi:hypothetical protein [Capnocytophaga bilenii]